MLATGSMIVELWAVHVHFDWAKLVGTHYYFLWLARFGNINNVGQATEITEVRAIVFTACHVRV